MTTKEYYQKNKEKCKLNNKEYRQINKEKERLRGYFFRKNNKEYFQLYRENNKKQIKAYHQKLYQNNKEKINLQNKKWRENNKNYFKEYYKNNPEINLKSNIKQLKKCASSIELPLERYRWMLQSWSNTVKKINGKRCSICGSIHSLNAHHIFEKSKYPELSLNISNGVTLCILCHHQAHGRFLEKNYMTKNLITQYVV